jgi:hypothetical protein
MAAENFPSLCGPMEREREAIRTNSEREEIQHLLYCGTFTLLFS